MQKINKSSKECAELNAANAEAISLGLVEAVEPDGYTLAREKDEADREARRAKERAEVAAMLPPFSAQFGAVTGAQSGLSSLSFKVGDVRVDAQRESAHRFSSEQVWKVTFIAPGVDKSTWMNWGATLAPDAAKLKKAQEKIRERQDQHDRVNLAKKVKEDGDAAWAKFYGDPANQDVVNALYLNSYRQRWCHSQFGSRRGYELQPDDFDGANLRVNGVTRTLAQWRQVIAIQQRHADEMAALLKRFKAPAAA